MDRPARSTSAALIIGIIVGTAAFGAGVLGVLGAASGAMHTRSDVTLMIVGVLGLGLVALASVVLMRLTQAAATPDD